MRFLRVTCATQCTATVLALLLTSGVFYGLTKNFLFDDEVLAAKDAELAVMRLAYDTLRAEVANDQAHYRLVTRQLETKHRTLQDVMAQNASLREELNVTSDRLQTVETQRVALSAQIDSLATDLAALRSDKDTLSASLDQREAQLHEAQAERGRVMSQRNRLQSRSDELQRRLAALQVSQGEMLERLADRTKGSIGELRDVIAKTGLDADRLLAEVSGAAGLGGPFVEASENEDDTGEMQIATLNSHIDQWGDLQQVLRRLPLSAPMDKYVARSPFGKRLDPFNGKWAVHSGVDLGGPPKAPILSTAPGVVVFAGSHPSYGRMVEIDHGMGVRTRYGHLNSFSVRKGQTVGYRQKIGVIGNSGRATGVHLHYEVLVNDTPHDPMRFIEAGKNVFKG